MSLIMLLTEYKILDLPNEVDWGLVERHTHGHENDNLEKKTVEQRYHPHQKEHRSARLHALQ